LLVALGFLIFFAVVSCGSSDPSGKYVYSENGKILGELNVTVENDTVTFSLTDFNVGETRSSLRPVSKDGEYTFTIEGNQVPLTVEADRILVEMSDDTTLVFLKE
jgi:hypothetical protein